MAFYFSKMQNGDHAGASQKQKVDPLGFASVLDSSYKSRHHNLQYVWVEAQHFLFLTLRFLIPFTSGNMETCRMYRRDYKEESGSPPSVSGDPQES